MTSTTDSRQAKSAQVALVTCSAMPSGDVDDAHLVAALDTAGLTHSWVEWNSANPRDLGDSFDIVVLRSPWDYPEQHERFLQWVTAIPIPVHNPPAVVSWNSNKSYLLDLAAAGVPAVPTQVVDSIDQDWNAPAGFDEIVVKPAIGVGSMGARRFTATDVEAAREHAAQLIRAGRPAMVQPYLPSVDAGSETALIHFDGVFSHSITKGAMLTHDGQRPLVDGLYVIENIDARVANDAQREVARRALAAIPNATTQGAPLYARVDLIDDDNGDPVVLELELIEPSLFFAFDPLAAGRFVDAIAGRL